MIPSGALAVQELGSPDDRVLVLGDVAGLRSEDGWFRPRDVTAVFDALRVPRVGNLGRTLENLRGLGLIVRRGTGGWWAVSPRGRNRITELIGAVDLAMLEAEAAGAPGSEFGARRHPLISPTLAPPGLTHAVEAFLGRFPFERNVFCMTRFPIDERDTDYLDPVQPALDTLRQACSQHGLNLLLAFDRQLDDQLYGNVAAHMWASQYGIGLLEDKIGRGLNYNVMIELGAMLMTGRRCALFKDQSVPDLPTDIAGHIYRTVDVEDEDTVGLVAHQWISGDLQLGRCSSCP